MKPDLVTIKPRQGWHSLNFPELWRYRELLLALSARDVKVRYKQTILGVAWAVIQPLATMVIFTLIFGRLAKIPSDGFPYPVFVFSGLLAWNFFSSAINASGTSLLAAGGLISKVYFPRIIIPLAAIGTSIIDFVIACFILLALMFFYGVALTWQVLLFPFFFAGLALLATGLGAWLSAVTVAYRDFRFVIPFVLQIWMYITPVIYPTSFIPENWRWLMAFNPVLGWVEGIRSAFLGVPIKWDLLAISALLTVAVLVIGMRYFERAERRFADVI